VIEDVRRPLETMKPKIRRAYLARRGLRCRALKMRIVDKISSLRLGKCLANYIRLHGVRDAN
jgi:hypothetical protein